MAKFLIDEAEAYALRNLLAKARSEGLLSDAKLLGNRLPLRFKLLEAMGATTANKANADIYFFGDSTANKIDTDFVVDDSSSYLSASSGDIGFCFATSQYNVAYIYNQAVASTATEYMGLASTDYASTDATIVVDNIEGMDGVSTQTSISVNNRFAWNVDNNDDVHFRWNQHTSQYDAIQMKCT